MLYHLSYNKRLKYLTPRIPRQAVKPEDTITPRICFSDDITKALGAGICSGLNRRICVYTYEGNPQIYKPKVKEVFDVKYTNEIWVKERIKVKLVGTIKITKRYEPTEHRSYVLRHFNIYHYDWEWVEKYC